MSENEQSSRFASSVVVSSASLDWRGIQLERYRYDGGEYISPALPEHAIGVHLGDQVLHLEQIRDGIQKSTALHWGQFVLIPAGLDNICRHHAGADELFLRLDTELVGEIGEEIGLDNPAVDFENRFAASDPALLQLAINLLREAQTPGLGGNLYVEAVTNQLIVHLIRQYAIHKPKSNSRLTEVTIDIRPAIEFIQDQLDQKLSLTDIAATVHLSAFHFSRAFKQRTGLSPHQYVIQQRIERAKALLLNPHQTVASVAAAVGFADHSHFVRHFKRSVGVTPFGYRNRKNIQN